MDQKQANEELNTKKRRLPKVGGKHIMIGAGVLAIGAIGFVGGVAYNANQQARENEAALRAAVDETEQLKQKLKEIDSQEDAETQDVDDQAAVKTEDPAKLATPAKPPTKPVQKPKTDTHKKHQVSITQAQPAVSAGSVTFTVQLPKSYGSNGYCKVLVKRDGDGAHAIERQAPLNNTSSCSITVSRSDLQPGITNWQSYVSFEDYSTKTYSGWQDRKTFTL